MLIERVALVVKDGLHGCEVALRIQPRIYVLVLDIDDRAVMPGCSDFRLRIICDGCE